MKRYYHAVPPSTMTKAVRLFFLLALTSVVGYIGSTFVTPEALAWYDGLIQSDLTPPDSWFGIVWGILYALMSIAAWLVWGKVTPRPFVFQLAFNLLWTFLFFYLKSPILALVDVVAMVACLIWTVVVFARASLWAAGLMIPTLIWSCFAFYLNLIVVLYNTQVGVWLGLI